MCVQAGKAAECSLVNSFDDPQLVELQVVTREPCAQMQSERLTKRPPEVSGGLQGSAASSNEGDRRRYFWDNLSKRHHVMRAGGSKM